MSSQNNKKFSYSFCRYEKKYLVPAEKYDCLKEILMKRMEESEFGQSLICNLYYDTPDFLLIRRSIQGGVYKEKLRLRSYGVPTDDSDAFIELKKKYNGVVYKRRICTDYKRADCYLNIFKNIYTNSQIANELNYTFHYYNLIPAMYISYEREALVGKQDNSIRITFDRNIIWRTDDLDLRDGVFGNRLLDRNLYLMEIKIPNSMPLWLSHTLNDLEIYPTSFSKYGRAYQKLLANNYQGDYQYDRCII